MLFVLFLTVNQHKMYVIKCYFLHFGGRVPYIHLTWIKFFYFISLSTYISSSIFAYQEIWTWHDITSLSGNSFRLICVNLFHFTSYTNFFLFASVCIIQWHSRKINYKPGIDNLICVVKWLNNTLHTQKKILT